MLKRFLSVVSAMAILMTTVVTTANAAPNADLVTLVTLDREVVQVTPLDLGGLVDIQVKAQEPVSATFTLRNTANGQTYNVLGQRNLIAGFNDLQLRPTVNGVAGAQLLPSGQYQFTVKSVAADNGDTDSDLGATLLTIVNGFPAQNNGNENENDDVNAPSVTSLEVEPQVFSPENGEDVQATCEVDTDSFRTVVVEDSNGVVVRNFDQFRGQYFRRGDNCTILWDGDDNRGNRVEEGVYFVVVTVSDVDGNDSEARAAVVVDNSLNNGEGLIESVELDPARIWDPSVEELEFEVDLVNDDARYLYVYMERTLVRDGRNFTDFVEIVDEDRPEDESDYTFDGTDDDGDYLEAGDWKFVVIVDGYVVERTIEVSYEQPELVEAFVTRQTFDPSLGEKVYLVVKSTVSAELTVELERNNRTEATLADEFNARKNVYYAFEWDGTDREGDLATAGQTYKFKIEAVNKTDDDISETAVVDVRVEDFDFDEREANITEDVMTPVVDDEAVLDFCIDEDAEVTVTVHEGTSTGGNEEAELLDEYEMEEGCNSVDWDVTDENGKRLQNGRYTYKIVSENEDGRRQTKTGEFAVGHSGVEIVVDGVSDDDDDDDNDRPKTCGEYVDTFNVSAETCDAIERVTKWGIFQGYEDDSFGPNNPITRAEVLKVLAMLHRDNMPTLTADGSTFGFSDLVGQEYSWPMPYVKTGVMNGYFAGYNENGMKIAGLSRTITKAELLKLTLETSSKFGGLNLSYNGNGVFYADVDARDWFAKYADYAYDYQLMNERGTGMNVFLDPNMMATRGEVALLITRMEAEGLIDAPGAAAPSRNVRR